MRFQMRVTRWVWLFSVVVISGCGSDRGAVNLDGPPGSQHKTATLLPSPLGNRTNPLQAYIRAYWTGGDELDVGGSRWNHIKTYGHNYTNLENIADGAAQAQFIADHFDAYTSVGSLVVSTALATNPDFLGIMEIANSTYFRVTWDSLQAEKWLSDPTQNEKGYSWSDLALHYKWDTIRGGGSLPSFIAGWNPADDPDSSGCRDATEGNGGAPSDSLRTAECERNANVLENNGSSWILGNVASPARIEATAEIGLNENPVAGIRGIHFDEVAYEAGFGAVHVLRNTFTYEGLNESDPGFPYPVDKLFFVPSVMNLYEQQTGPFIHIANMVSPRYTCSNQGPEGQKDAAFAYLENIFNETWMVSDGSWNYTRISDYLDCPLVEWMEKGKGYIFTCRDAGSTDRAKLFSLATFYMINHQMAFYYYTTNGHISTPGSNVADWQWNPFVEFDIGQPVANTQGLPDFQGNTGTTKYFVWATNPNYKILGREYLRPDGQRTLVLAKTMANGLTEGADVTTHTLPRQYKRLIGMPAVFDSPSCTVFLANNEGAILVEVGTCSGGGNGGGKNKPQG